MESTLFLGICMDHSKAHLIGYNDDSIFQTIKSEFTYQKKSDALSHSESGMHHKEHQLQEKYFKKLGKEIAKYSQVLLFGPTEAKLELHNYLIKDQLFKDIKFDIINADKMTTNEQIAFVTNHFKKVLK